MAIIVNIGNLEREETAFSSGLIFTGPGVKAPLMGSPLRDNRLTGILLLSLFIHMAALVTAFVFFMDSSGSGAGQSFVMVEISGLMADGGAGEGQGAVMRDKAEGFIREIAVPAKKISKKNGTHLAKKAATAVRPVKGTKEAKEIKAPALPVAAAHYAVTEEAAVDKEEAAAVKERDLNKSEVTPEALSLATNITPSPAVKEERLLAVEGTPSAMVQTLEAHRAEVSAVSYLAPSGAASGHGARGGDGAGEKRRAGGQQGGLGRGAMIQGLKAPPYPPFSRLRGEEGTVKLQIEVGADGGGAEISLKSSSGHARLDRAAIKAIEKAHLIPAMSNGRPAASTKTVVFVFKLKD